MRSRPLPPRRLFPRIAAAAVVISFGAVMASSSAAEEEGAAEGRAEEELPEASIARLERPIWLLGLGDPTWLFSHRGSTTGAEVTVFAFSNLSAKGEEEPRAQRENDAGRATRSLPLFLAERAFIETDCEASAQVVVVPGLGPVVSGTPWPFEALRASAGDDPPDLFVTGVVERQLDGVRNRVTVELLDGRTGKRVHGFEETKFFDAPNAGALALARAFVSHLVESGRCRRVEPPAGWAPPSEALVGAYLDALGQLVPQVLADVGLVTTDSIWGEEDMLAWYAALREQMPTSLAARLIFLRGVLLSRAYGGKAHESHAPALVAELLASESADDPVHRLSPLALARLGRGEECAARRAELLLEAEGAYGRWLQAVPCATTPVP